MYPGFWIPSSSPYGSLCSETTVTSWKPVDAAQQILTPCLSKCLCLLSVIHAVILARLRKKEINAPSAIRCLCVRPGHYVFCP